MRRGARFTTLYGAQAPTLFRAKVPPFPHDGNDSTRAAYVQIVAVTSIKRGRDVAPLLVANTIQAAKFRFGQPLLGLSLASIAFLKSVSSPSGTWLPYPALDDARCAEVDEHTVVKLDMISTIKPRFLIRFWCNIAPLTEHENALCRDKAFH